MVGVDAFWLWDGNRCLFLINLGSLVVVDL